MSSDDDQDIAALEAALARAHAKKQRKLDQEQRRRDSGPQELVPGTPSPRKKRRSDAADLASLSRPAPPALFNNPVLARSFNPSDKLQLRDAPRRESQFVDHMSAVPKSFADALAERKTLDRVKQERKERQLENRARRGAADQGGPGGFSDLSSASKDVLLSGRTGDVRLKEKKSRPEAGDRAASTRSATAASSSSTSAPPRPSAPSVPAMSRPAPLGTSSTASSSRAPARPAPSTAGPDDDDLAITNGPARRTRRRDGTYIETVQMGSREFIAPSDDPTWERVEPYSGIRLRERLLPHADLDMLLDGRYHLTPAQVYSLARIDSRKRIDLDPDVIDSDFVVIGVLAWKDEVRFLNSGAMGGKKPPASAQDKGKGKGEGGDGASEDDDVDSLDEDEHELGRAMGKGKGKARRQQKKDDDDSRDTLFRQPNKRQRRQRYLRFELVDLSSTQASSAADGRLSVMLVQADSEDKAVDDEGNEVSVYKGQSGGAFEKFWKETAGAVVAIVNPTFLPHNKDFSYTLKPTSADSMVVLGRADNLAFCEATKADGKRCGQWVDARMGRVCQFHVERAIKRTGVRRAETNANTGSLSAKGTFNQAAFTRSLGGSSSSASSRLGSTGPVVKQRPLSPPPGMPRNAKVIAGSTTYVTTGGRSSASSSLTSARANTLPLGRPGGGFIPGLREGPSVSDEKKRRQRQVNDDKRARQELRALVGRDKGKTPGGEYLLMSRKRKQDAAGGQGSSGDEDGGGERLEGDSGGEGGKKDKKPGIFRPEALRRIGYNPTVKAGDLQRDESDEAKRHRLALEDGLGERKIKLSAPKGAKRTAVSAPAGTEPLAAEGGDDDDDLVIEGGPTERVKLVFPPKKAD
ncbi:uncharacterized protein RHOBADRAFT_56171 [Rhodotorula graminis WP1]|uniref:Zinc finger Mcm10/DnaG-type domain-containing protein n=1 Tax=Rhodotorula graminis (strain WP1) TaxID=578459 RepID=A0A0N8PZD7_RHOGW|nr:uncharacterized protein RHOBADRAFT_56171 [Rhodotorula graminis WP1]KPV72037.1 hypothetical protein RHOBADRAFT_56171 [Rhodotorula graminis WP1]